MFFLKGDARRAEGERRSIYLVAIVKKKK